MRDENQNPVEEAQPTEQQQTQPGSDNAEQPKQDDGDNAGDVSN